ncbi:profilin, required for normal timing of actin polymerization in response to thermal stress [Coemansia spiralis]|nr:profilin, required for normal timing of actin polymerization in response to thermal stress [Coemansia spiralis]
MSSSWDSYITEILKVEGVASAAILGKDTGELSVWARSDDFSTDDLSLLDVVKGFSDQDMLRAGGIRLRSDEKYMTTIATDDFVHGKKGDNGVMLFDAGTGIIAITYDATGVAGTISAGVARFADYLKTVLV